MPRVKLETTKGDIVVELFENEAPDTVGNFVYLVKRGFYDELTFHDVQSGFMAQTGCPHGDGTGGPGYTIYDECDKPGARKHFRGVLSMANRNVPNSGDSQFFITYRPAPRLDGRHTVFGRVIEGMDVVTRLQRRTPQDPEPPEPDKILKAEVLRDRGHEYLPNKVQ
ncbi:MAG: peptidylprolyl isomerase [Planctomycetota bacterium]